MKTDRPLAAVITGAARGIGAEVATRLAGLGYALGLIDVDAKGLRDLAERLEVGGAQVRTQAVDVRDAGALIVTFSSFSRDFGGIDVLVNGAGVAYFGGIAQCSAAEWAKTMEINVGGYFNAARAALPYVSVSPKAHIINMSSVWAFDGSPSMAAYATSKHAVEGLTSCLRKEVGPKGVKVTSLVLDKVDTDFRESMAAYVNFDATQRQRMLAATDVADALVYVLQSSDRCLPSTITLDAWLWR